MNKRGFTLIELVVVILIIGILAAIGLPQYILSVETSKALDAASLVTMIGTTNRMYSLDHTSTLTTGELTNSCSSEATCPGGTGTNDPCQLIACKYLAMQDFNDKPYAVEAVAGAASCPNAPFSSLGNWSPALAAGTQLVACAARQGNCSGNYCNWGYAVDVNGQIYEAGNTGTNANAMPPAPVQ